MGDATSAHSRGRTGTHTFGCRPRREVTQKIAKGARDGRAPVVVGKSRPARPGVENCLDELLGRVGRGRAWLVVGKRGFRQDDGLAITVEIPDAPGAFS